MTSAAYTVAVPADTLATLPTVDFRHACAVDLAPGAPRSVDYWSTTMFRDPPRALRALMRGRDLLVRPFGLKPVTGPGGSRRVGPFPLVDRRANELVFGLDDRHLDFRTSILVEESSDGARVVCATVAGAHSALGKAYLVPVRVAHPRLVALLLERAAAVSTAGPDAGPHPRPEEQS